MYLEHKLILINSMKSIFYFSEAGFHASISLRLRYQRISTDPCENTLGY